jgi:putative spermidine/putrescine transport system permease protein
MQADSAMARQKRRTARLPPFTDIFGWSWGLLPAGIVLLVSFGLPIANLAVHSLHETIGPAQEAPGLTFRNYIDFFGDPFYWTLLFWTSILGALVSIVSALLAFPVAYYLARSRGPLKEMIFFAVVAPLLISVVIRNLGWIPVLGENGLVNWLLQRLGLITTPLHLINNLFGVTVGLVHGLLPFFIITLTTVIQRVGPELEEASLSLGAGPARTFFQVLLPLSAPGLLAGGLIVFTLTISAYTTPALMGGGRIIVIATYIQQEIATLLDYAKGATVAVVLMVWCFVLSLLAARLGQKEA